MGLEALCTCRVNGTQTEAKVLLEATELILRSPFRLRVRIADLVDVVVAEDELRFRFGNSTAMLRLGVDGAARWARKIATPPPGLAQKLGIGRACPVYVIGAVEDSRLLNVLDGHTAEATGAKLSIAVVLNAADLVAALAVHESAMRRASIWIVHGKGRGVSFGETAVRDHMRARGYSDTKVSAVSDKLSATRYSPP